MTEIKSSNFLHKCKKLFISCNYKKFVFHFFMRNFEWAELLVLSNRSCFLGKYQNFFHRVEKHFWMRISSVGFARSIHYRLPFYSPDFEQMYPLRKIAIWKIGKKHVDLVSCPWDNTDSFCRILVLLVPNCSLNLVNFWYRVSNFWHTTTCRRNEELYMYKN